MRSIEEVRQHHTFLVSNPSFTRASTCHETTLEANSKTRRQSKASAVKDFQSGTSQGTLHVSLHEPSKSQDPDSEESSANTPVLFNDDGLANVLHSAWCREGIMTSSIREVRQPHPSPDCEPQACMGMHESLLGDRSETPWPVRVESRRAVPNLLLDPYSGEVQSS